MSQPRRLRRLIAVIVGAAVTVAAAALVATVGQDPPPLWRVAMSCGLLIASRMAVLHLRFRGQRVDFDWGEGALLLGLVLVPTAWLTILTPFCVAAAALLLAKFSIKTVYNAASATLATAAAGTVAGLLSDPTQADLSWRLLGALGLASVLFTAMADLTASAAIALSQSEPFLPTLRVGLGMEALTGAGNVGAALAIVAVARFDPWLLLVLPMLVGSLQISYGSRLRAQQERTAWTQLEKTTRAFTQLDPIAVAEAAIAGIVELFQADRVHVRICNPAGVEVHYSGGRSGLTAAAPEPTATGPSLTVPLGQPDQPVGTLTLHFSADVTLNDRERHALATLATALTVALGNAERYEATRGLAEEKAREAVTDPLTGVGNRTHLRQAGPKLLTEAAQRGQPTAMLLVDLDHFKEVNDTLGYDTGDRLLVEAARRITDTVSWHDLVVRLGSHVFAILLTDLTSRTADDAAEQLTNCLDAPMILDGLHLRAPSTIGIACAPDDADTISALLQLTDAALLRAKSTAMRWARYTAATDQPHADRLLTVAESRTALTSGQFLLHYQPKIDVSTGQVTGVEALIRWQHPTRGLLWPISFMSAIEHSALVDEFTLNILDMGLGDCAAWLSQDPTRTLAVNLSARNLLNPHLPHAVVELLRAHHIPGRQLILEVTETAIMSDLDTVDSVLAELRRGGVQLSLDDFGTGYSSLTFLSRIPVDEVKIDRSFISRMLTSSRDDVVVRGTISLAHGLGLRVVAEGVETQAEQFRLLTLGCERAQGYYYSRPIPIDMLQRLPSHLPKAPTRPVSSEQIPTPRAATQQTRRRHDTNQ